MVQNFEFQYFLGFSEKIIFSGYEDFVDIFLASSQNWTIFSCHVYAFKGIFLRSRYRNGDIFWVAKISIIFFLGCLKFLINDVLELKGRDSRTFSKTVGKVERQEKIGKIGAI